MSEAVTGQRLDTLGMIDITMGKGQCYLGDEVLSLLRKSELAPASCTAQITESITVPPSCEPICKVALIPPVVNANIPVSYSGCLEPRQLEMYGIHPIQS